MTLEALYFAMQIIAALAIIASLLFVGLQLRAQTREQRQIRIQSRNETLDRYFSVLNQAGEHREILVRGLDNFGSLSPADRILFDNILTATARAALVYERQLLDGDISKASFQQYVDYMTPIWGAPGTAAWLEVRGNSAFGSAFSHIEPIIGSADGRAAHRKWRREFLGMNDDD